jgi:hypothetical protein
MSTCVQSHYDWNLIWGGGLSWYCGHFWPIIQAPDDRGWLWSNWWNEDWQGQPKYSEKTCPSATLSTTNPTWPDPGSNLGCRGGKPATNRLSYGADWNLSTQSKSPSNYWNQLLLLVKFIWTHATGICLGRDLLGQEWWFPFISRWKKQDSEKEICLQRQWCKVSGLYVNAEMWVF